MIENEDSEELGKTQLQLLKGAKSLLNTATNVWKVSLIMIVGSLSVMGITALLLYITVLAKDILFTEGIIFLAVAAWILARSLTGQCCSCCTVEIPRWKNIISLFAKPDGTIDVEREGRGVVDTIMEIVLASEGWIGMIRRELLSMLIWPILAVLMLLLTVYTVEATLVRTIAVAFIAYSFLLTFSVYFGVKLKFQAWERRVGNFKVNIDRTLSTLQGASHVNPRRR